MLGLELENAKNWFWPILRVILGHKSAKNLFSKYTMFFTGVDYPISDIELCMVLRFILHRFNATYIYKLILKYNSLQKTIQKNHFRYISESSSNPTVPSKFSKHSSKKGN